jgi:transmembrane sensor
MSAPHIPSDNNELTRAWDEANEWMLRLHSGLTSDERREFEAWHAQSPIHRAQFRDAERFWLALDALTDQVVREEPRAAYGRFVTGRTLPRTLGLQFRWSAIAAAFLLVFTALFVWPMLTLWLNDYQTASGEQKAVGLADGSTVVLNTFSAFSVNLSEQRRSLTLTQGEALFEVSHDIERPFEVTVDGWIVRAVGTTFNIDRHTNTTTVTVIDGAVRLLHDKDVWDIPVGHRITYDKHHIVGKLEPADVAETIAWRKGEFVFTDMPFGMIVEELNRYRPGRIVIAAPPLRDLRLSGSVALDDPDHSLRMLQQVYPFRIIRLTSYITIVL